MGYTRGPGPLQGEHDKLKSAVGIVEDGDTATHAIAKGQYVIWKDDLYTAKSDISIGTTLSSSNLQAKTKGIGEDVASLNSNIEKKTRWDAFSDTEHSYNTQDAAQTIWEKIPKSYYGCARLTFKSSWMAVALISKDSSGNGSMIYTVDYIGDVIYYGRRVDNNTHSFKKVTLSS